APTGATFADMVRATHGKKPSQTRPPPAPPVSASPTRRHHPQRLVLGTAPGSAALDLVKIRSGWVAATVQVAARTTRFKLQSWSITSGGNLVVTTDVLALSITPAEMDIIQEAVKQHCGVTATNLHPDCPRWLAVVEDVAAFTNDNGELVQASDLLATVVFP